VDQQNFFYCRWAKTEILFLRKDFQAMIIHSFYLRISLWKRKRHDLLNEFFHLGFKAVIIAVKQGILSESFLGCTLDQDVISEMEKVGIDASGEEGEYHTVVTDGPIFSSGIHLGTKEQFTCDGYCFLDICINN
jgi:diphthine-ammonia ligase